MSWDLIYLPEAEKDLLKLDNSLLKSVRKTINRVAENPLPKSEGGYGKPLGGNLAGCNKIKLRDIGLRVVYKLKRIENKMLVIVISARADGEAYTEAEKRIGKYGL